MAQLKLQNVALHEKIELITIICFDYNRRDVNKPEKFVNYFLVKTSDPMTL